MAEKNRYPQIPSTVWWGVRAILIRTPKVTIDEKLLGVELNVQEAAARQYVAELSAVGILTPEGKATPLAEKWRLEDHYQEAVDLLLQKNYPESLRTIGADFDRQKIVSWFLREGLGQGAAGNKAATYLLIGSPTPNEAASTGGTRVATGKTPRKSIKTVASSDGQVSKQPPKPSVSKTIRPGMSGGEGIPLNINVQIHISADAGSEQIESIFSAMRRYLYDAPGN